VAAGEDQAQHVVAEGIFLLLRRYDLPRDLGLGLEVPALRPEQDLPAQAIDRLVASDIDQPGARARRHACGRPLLEGRRERLLQGVLGELEIADKADQRREDATRLVPEHMLRVAGDAACAHPHP